MPSLQASDELQNSEQSENNGKSENTTPISLKNVIKESLITQGNIGEIFRVIDKNTNHHYISKTLYVHYQDYPKKSRINIIKHLNKMKQLNFPAILKLYDFNTNGFDKETRQTILLEYLQHGSLEDILNSQFSSLNNTKKHIIIYGIAKAFQYLHSHDILHHDLKPSSIMIDDNLYPKVGNIGFSNLFYSLKSMAKIKELSPYTAPEYITNGEYSKKSEVYAFGMIVYQIITNKKPFENFSQFEMLQRIVSHDLPTMDDSIPKVYRDLIEKCCAFDPNDRYNFEEICKELKDNDDFLVNLENEDEFKQYIELIEDFVEENKSFNQIFESDNSMIENKEINQKKMKKKRRRKKKE